MQSVVEEKQNLRIIAGQYRGRKLKSPPALDTRPTSDRLRETLFNVIAPRIREARFLDLCAGSGAVGIEALSRSAAHVTLVDRSRKMCDLITTNLELCRITPDQAEVMASDALEFLRRPNNENEASWDVVFFDPPYADDYLPVLDVFGSQASRLSDAGILIVEHHHKNDLPDCVGELSRQRVLKQGESSLSFYARSQKHERQSAGLS